jgi:hypothetical protein
VFYELREAREQAVGRWGGLASSAVPASAVTSSPRVAQLEQRLAELEVKGRAGQGRAGQGRAGQAPDHNHCLMLGWQEQESATADAWHIQTGCSEKSTIIACIAVCTCVGTVGGSECRRELCFVDRSWPHSSILACTYLKGGCSITQIVVGL